MTVEINFKYFNQNFYEKNNIINHHINLNIFLIYRTLLKKRINDIVQDIIH